MRPRMLEIEGLQSFRALQRIDFDALSENGLFGIFGPTGSGKSTILDAITLALYGRIKRAEGGTQGIINSQEQQVRVAFTFELQKDGARKCYRAERLYQRKKGTANQCEAKLARLIEITPSGEVPVCDKATEVTSTIQGLLGLSEKDFTRAVVLPQNSFQEFLLLSNKDRRDMLERIFYLEEYGRELNEKLNRRIWQLKSRMDALSGELKGYEDATDDALKQAEESVSAAAVRRKDALQAFSQSEKRYLEAREIWGLVQDLAFLQDKELAHLERKEQMGRLRLRLEQASHAQSIAPLIQQVRELRVKLDETRIEHQALLDKLPGLAKQLDEMRRDEEALAIEAESGQPRLIAARARLEDALALEDELEESTLKVSRLEEEWAGMNRSIGEASDDLQRETREMLLLEKAFENLKNEAEALMIDPGYRQAVQLGLAQQRDSEAAAKQCKELEEKAAGARKTVGELETQMESLSQDLSVRQKEWDIQQNSLIAHEGQMPEDRNTLMQKTERLHGLKTVFGILTIRSHEAAQWRDKYTTLADQLKDRQAGLAQLSATEERGRREVESCREALASLQKAWEQNTASLLSHTLKAGEPCPVCGSSHHPAPAHESEASEGTALQSRIEEEKKRLTAAETAHKQAEKAVLVMEGKIRSIEEQMAELGREMDDKAAGVEAEKLKLPETLRSMSLEDIGRELERMERISHERLQALELWEKVRKDYQERVQALGDSLAGMRLSENSLETRLKVSLESLVQWEQALEDARTEAHQHQVRYRSFLEQYGIASAQEEMARITDADEKLQATRGAMDGLQKSIAEIRAVLEDLGLALQNKKAEKLQVEAELNRLRLKREEQSLRIRELAGEGDIKTGIAQIELLLADYKDRLAKLKTDVSLLDAEHRALENRQSILANQTAIHADSLKKDEQKLSEGLVEKGFDSPEEAILALLPPEEVMQGRQALERFDQEALQLRSQRQILEGKLQGKSLTEGEWADCLAAYEEAAAAKETQVSQHEVAKSFCETVRGKHIRWSEIKRQYDETTHRHGLYEQIQKLLRADLRKDNSFIDFIAEERLRYVAAKASETLGCMTRFKYALELDAESGFIIRDNANGGVCRMVSSLSGGETFLTSLSLALALSEQIQLKGQSPLEFFFLDEGFGTLDSSLLDHVMDALERLSKRERVIGLISHVPELKSRMARRLVIEPPNSRGEGSMVSIEKA